MGGIGADLGMISQIFCSESTRIWVVASHFFFTPNLGKNDPIWLLTTLLGTNISLGPKAFLSRWFSQLPQVGPMWSFPRWDNIFQLGWFNHHLDMKPWINIVPDGALEPLLPDHSFQPFTPRQNSFNRLLASGSDGLAWGDEVLGEIQVSSDHVSLVVWDTRWWQLKDFWNFHPYLGKVSNLTNIFQRGWNHQLGYIKDEKLPASSTRQLPWPKPSYIYVYIHDSREIFIDLTKRRNAQEIRFFGIGVDLGKTLGIPSLTGLKAWDVGCQLSDS